MKTVILTLIFIGLLPQLSSAQTDSTISLKDAIKIAERYILINGFTSKNADTTKLSYEFLYDDGMSKTAIAARRKNTLHPRAFCTSESENEWYIGFLSTTVKIDKLTEKEKNQNLPGKAVIITKDLTEIRMAHKNPLFSKWSKVNNRED